MNKKDYIKITRWPLELYFRDGVTKIYYKGFQITNKVGLGILFKSKKEEHSSVEASWEARKQDDFKIVAVAKLKGLPVSQEWELEILDSSSIGWKIVTNITKKREIKNLVFSLQLSPIYKQWLSSQDTKEFSNENFLALKKIILPESIQDYIGVHGYKRNRLLKVIFNPLSCQFKIIPAISWNRNRRVLGFVTKENKDAPFLLPRKYNFFSEILIGEDKEGI
jgi:hypothetical protein